MRPVVRNWSLMWMVYDMGGRGNRDRRPKKKKKSCTTTSTGKNNCLGVVGQMQSRCLAENGKFQRGRLAFGLQMGFARRCLGRHPLKSTTGEAASGLSSPAFPPFWHQSCSAPERASVALRCLGWLQASCANAYMLELYQRRHPFGFQPSSQPCLLRHR